MRFVVLALLLGAGLAAHADVYRWVDDQGNVHYGDQPPAKAERLSRSTPRFDVDAGTEDTAEEDAAAPEPTPSKETPFAAGKDNASAQERCDEFRARVTRYEGAGDMFIDNPDGSRHKLADEERDRLISRTRQQADEACAQAEG